MKRRNNIKKRTCSTGIGRRWPLHVFSSWKGSFLTTAHAANGGFVTPLPIPPLLENLDKSGETARFAMNAQQDEMNFFPGKSTASLGYNGNFLGPTIRVRNGQRFTMRASNSLDQETTLHWHGLHVPAQWDGGPRQAHCSRKHLAPGIHHQAGSGHPLVSPSRHGARPGSRCITVWQVSLYRR